MKRIYLDTASTTPVDKKVIAAMQPYWSGVFGNPSSIHGMGVAAESALEGFRKIIAGFFAARSKEIIFTSGGTEANALAIIGVLKPLLHAAKKPHVITTAIEHSSVLECLKDLEQEGVRVSYLAVHEDGLVNPKDLRNLIRPETALIAIGYANGEIGTVQPVKEIMKEVRHARFALHGDRFGYPYVHLDAAQAAQYEHMHAEELGADLISIDAQKIYGPKGIGALYVRAGTHVSPILFGGGQERGMRSGTENIPLIAGFAKAIEILERMKAKEMKRIAKLRDGFFNKVKKSVPTALINGSRTHRLANNINISIPGHDGELLVLRLDEKGIVASAASACASGSGESAVVRVLAEAAGVPEKTVDDRARSTLRFTLGRETKSADITRLLSVLPAVCK